VVGGRVYDASSGRFQTRDILVDDKGTIAELDDRLQVPAGVRTIDATDRLVIPAFIDCHQHLDKTGSLPFTPNPSGTLTGAIQSFGRFARQTTPADIRTRALRTITRCLRRGTTAIRSHVNLDPDAGMVGLEALADVRAELKHAFTLQLVTFLTSGATRDLEWLRLHGPRGARLGDAIGGTPALSPEPDAYLDGLFRIAADAGLPVDLHMDEHLRPEAALFDKVLSRVETFGMRGRVTLGHCSVLGAMAPGAFERIRDRLLENEVSVVTLPAANLFLQGRDADRLPPRGLTRVRELFEAGVTVATASDNIHDAFVPIGSGDMAEIARWTFVAALFFSDDLPKMFDMITLHPSRVMGLEGFGKIEPGRVADFLIVDATDISDLIATGPFERQVIARGHLVEFSDPPKESLQ
jgi:cytosine deaminase